MSIDGWIARMRVRLPSSYTRTSDMRTIWKYDIPLMDTVMLMMPVRAKPLFVAVQSGQLCMWCEVETTDAALATRWHVRGTGNPLTGEEDRYIGSAQVGPFVWHVFSGAFDESLLDDDV